MVPHEFGNFLSHVLALGGLAVFVPCVLPFLAKVDGIHRRRATTTRWR